jgi:hypothetical protein
MWMDHSFLMRRSGIAAALLYGVCSGCSAEPMPLADEIASELIAMCPPADRDDPVARNECAGRLTKLAVLQNSMSEPFRWGSQGEGKGPRLEHNNTTDFNPYVWRSIYLPLFMWTGTYTVENIDGVTVLAMPFQFRNALDAGEYPYPFWHSKAKWDSWQNAAKILFIIRDGKLIGALRSFEKREGNPNVPREWDGQWHWVDDKGVQQPHVTLYSYLLSPANPHVQRLDTAYRALESDLRLESCLTCHSPDNGGKMNPLELFSFPNQALHSRHAIVQQLEVNVMPPAPSPTTSPGMLDEAKRQSVIKLAKEFEAAAEEALRYEGEVL